MFYGLPKNLVNFFRNEEIPETVTIYITKSAQSFKSDGGKGKMVKRFSCSSIILAIHSERFKRIVSSGTNEIFLECFESPSEINAVKHIFEFMYGDRSAVNRVSDISVVCKFAHIWEVPSLWLACIDHIKSSLSSDPIKLFDYYKMHDTLTQSYNQLDELWREFNRVAQENADILIRYIMSAKGPKEVDFRILKELIENSKTAICGEYVSLLVKRGGVLKTFLKENLHLIPVTTAFANEKELHEFKKLFNLSEWPELIPLIIKYEQKIGKYEPFVPVRVNNHSKVKKSKQRKKRSKPKNLNDLVESSKPFPNCSNTDITTSTLKNFGEEFMQERAPCFSGKRLVELLDCSKKEAVKDNWEDDSFDEADSLFSREAQDSIESPSDSFNIKSNDPKNVLNKHIISSQNWEESISQFHDEAHDWGDSTSTDFQILIRGEIFLLLRNPDNMSLKKLIRSSQKYSLFTRLEMLGLKLNNETKYGVSKLISTLSPFFEDPRTPSCMLEDFEKLAIKSVLGNQEVLSQKLKELSKKQRKPTTVISQAFPCTVFFESVRSKGQISISSGPFKELLVDFSSGSYVKFSANPSKYENYILHSYVLRLYDDGCSIFTYVPIMLLKVNDIQYLFETGKGSKYGSVRIVVVLSESIPANDGFYEGALVCNTLDC